MTVSVCGIEVILGRGVSASGMRVGGGGGGGDSCRDLYEHWTVITRPAYLQKVRNLFV